MKGVKLVFKFVDVQRIKINVENLK